MPSTLWKLVKSVQLNNTKGMLKHVTIYCCPDVVSKFEHDNNNVTVGLINPCNQTLSGTALPYFPIGGPLPVLPDTVFSNSNSWGGMEAGSSMLYPAQAVDGVVHMEGGSGLKNEIHKIPNIVLDTKVGIFEDEASSVINIKVEVGNAVHTIATERLNTVHGYRYIIHTPPPFFNGKNSSELLVKCYVSSIELCFVHRLNVDILCCPLLGSGACGVPKDVAFQSFLRAIKEVEHRERPADTKPIRELRLAIPSMANALSFVNNLI
jgi:O-acetyl-ADP-ribose deacetylase (regulator of RNase III)